MPLVKIDRSTIKRNERAGETQSTFVGLRSGSRTLRTNESGRGKTEYQVQVGENEWFTQRCEITPWPHPESALGIADHREDVQLETVGHMPIPTWSYQYVPTPVTCSNCGKTFMHTELDSDSSSDGEGGDVFVDDICPNCGTPDCCEVVFEKIADALKDVA